MTQPVRYSSRGPRLLLAAALLLAAGIYQWLPHKAVCLEHCRGPLHFLLGYWQPGPLGGWRMGLAHGAYCLGCCWALMLLLFAGGVMNLTMIAALTAFVAFEKLAPIAGEMRRMSRAAPA